MGRYGGFELSYGSDADVLFVHVPDEGADPQVRPRPTPPRSPTSCAACSRCRAPTRPSQVDADLRPEGKQGALVRTLDSYAAYYAKWSKVWEAQALLRADAVVGDPDAARRLHRADRPAALPRGGAVRRRRRRGAPHQGPRRHTSGCPRAPTRTCTSSSAAAGWPTSSGPSSCSRCATPARCRRCAPRAPCRRWRPPARPACSTADDADVLAEAWRTVSRVRNAVTLARGKAADQLPARRARAGRRRQHPGLPAGQHRRDGQRLPARRPGWRAASSTGCSGDPSRERVTMVPNNAQRRFSVPE